MQVVSSQNFNIAQAGQGGVASSGDCLEFTIFTSRIALRL